MLDNENVLAEFKKIEVDRIFEMAKTGQISLMSESGRKITGVMSAILVNATDNEAWEILLNYEAYCKYLPGIQTSKVLSRCENTIVVRFVAGVKIMGIGGTVKYTYRLIINKPYVDVYDASTGDLTGYWAILETPDTNQVILAHADVAKDVGASSVFVKFMIEQMPTADIAFNISPVAMTVNRMARRMEQARNK
ncbi:MAG: hypothetical protein WCX65_15940 [bacterium]